MVTIEYPVDALVSYHYFRRDEDMAHVLDPRLRLIADSGAFSAYRQGAPVVNSEYASWLRKWGDRMFWCASLDVFGDPHATMANFNELLDEGIRTVPTIHVGCDPAWLDEYAKVGVDFVGLGGMVGLGTRVIRWLVHVLRYARDRHPGMRFHGWGITHPPLLEKLPLYSVDSSGLLANCYRFARLRLYDPQSHRHVNMPLDGRAPYQHRLLLTSTYGAAPADIARSHIGNRSTLIQIATRSAQLYASALQIRHQVTPPAWGINDAMPLAGTRLHAANAAPVDFSRLLGTRLHVVRTG